MPSAGRLGVGQDPSITSRLAMASAGGVGTVVPSLMARRTHPHAVLVSGRHLVDGDVRRHRWLATRGARIRWPGRRDVERNLDQDPARGPVDVDPLIGLQLGGAGEGRWRPSKSSNAEVNTSVPKAGSRLITPRTRVGSVPNNIRVALTVAPDVHERPTDVGDVANVLGIDVVIGEEDLYRQIADGPFGEQPPYLDPKRVKPVHEGLHQPHPGRVRRLHHLPRLGAARRAASRRVRAFLPPPP